LTATRAAENAVHTIESTWGRFSFRRFELMAPNGDLASALVISRLAIEPVRLTEGAARLGLTAQQREVALMLTQGSSNADIAAQLGVSINTANYHVKKLFMRLGVHERQQIAQVLRAAAAGTSSATVGRQDSSYRKR
jgi:DNA-binding CsgD family transcriptional regulator